MTKRFLQNRAAVFTSILILVVACIGIFAPIIAPNDLMKQILSINLLNIACNIHWEPINWEDVCYLE